MDREDGIENSPKNMERFSETLPQVTELVFESSLTWYRVYLILGRRHHVALSNRSKAQAIAPAKLKTDRVDALTVVSLRRGYMAESYIPTKKTMDLREPSGTERT